MANEFVGAQQFCHIYAETTFNVKPGSPVYIPCPVPTFDVGFRPETRLPRPFHGFFQSKGQRRPFGQVAGALGGPLLGYHVSTKSIAQWLTEWAFNNPESSDLLSKGIQWQQGPNIADEEYHGVVINTFSITGSEESGVVEFSADTLGCRKTELDTPQSVPTNTYDLTDFEFADCEFSIDTVDVPDLSAFTLNQNNAPKFKRGLSRTPTLIKRGTNQTGFQFVIPKNGNTYTMINEDLGEEVDFALELVIRALHKGSGASDDWTVGTLTIPKARFTLAADQGGLEDIKMVAVDCNLMKPESSSHALSWAWTLE